jgi:hypothetical protein
MPSGSICSTTVFTGVLPLQSLFCSNPREFRVRYCLPFLPLLDPIPKICYLAGLLLSAEPLGNQFHGGTFVRISRPVMPCDFSRQFYGEGHEEEYLYRHRGVGHGANSECVPDPN